MNIFDKEFFPTPKEVILQMVRPYAERLGTATILEPSAGNGAILSVITDGVPYRLVNKRGQELQTEIKADEGKVFCIEKNPELQMILQQKGFHLVANDFLAYTPDIRYDLILMNPPFSQGDRHLLHAWEILRSGDIACLLNAETINNPCTAHRQLLAKIIEQNGTVEELGPCFHSADNPTDVNIALVRLHKDTQDDTFKLDLDGFAKEAMPDFGELASSGDAVMQSNRLDAFLRSWEMAKTAAVNYIKAREMLKLYMGAFLTDNSYRTGNVINDLEKYLDTHRDSGAETRMSDGYNHFVNEAKTQAWSMIFSQIGLGRYMTSGLKQKLQEYQSGQSSFGITKENIMNLFQFIMFNLGDIMDNAIVEVYDLFTRYFKDNTSHTEGWKTNKQYKCNRKVILPNSVECGFMPQRYGYDKHFSPGYSSREKFDDIDKAMCWLSGRNFDSLTGKMDIPGQGECPSPENSTIAQTVYRIAVGDQDWHESAFFRIKAFKKGTIHLEFKDEALWAKFNLVVNKAKNLIGAGEAA